MVLVFQTKFFVAAAVVVVALGQLKSAVVNFMRLS